MLLLSTLLPTATPLHTYLGPTHCNKQGHTATSVVQSNSKGYSSFNHLLFDIVSLTHKFKSGIVIPEEQLTFTICAGSTIDLDDSSVPLGFLPIEIPRLTIKCGDTGKRGKTGSHCIIRGGGKRNPKSTTWNTNPESSFKVDEAGILGGGASSVAQIYVYGESAYEITLQGLTFDNSVTLEEKRLYNEYVAKFGSDEELFESSNTDDVYNALLDEINGEQEYEAATNDIDWGELGNGNRRRNLQSWLQDGKEEVKPAHRFASVAVRGKGYGDDAGPRLITIEDCRFVAHRGYAILVSPGIQEPDMPMAPTFDFPPSVEPHSMGDNDNNNDAGIMPSFNVQNSGEIYNGLTNGGEQSSNNSTASGQRSLNLLDDGEKFIPHDGLVSYYDHSVGKASLDSRRVKIIKSEFANNIVDGENVAGLVTSAYSLTLTDCFFQKNSAKAMVFIYNNEAIIDNSVFGQNIVEVSTVIMSSPKGSKPKDSTDTEYEPGHIIERSCFLGSNVGMSNVLVTDVENTGFGQSDNHATGTQFTWASTCEGSAAEQYGNDCLDSGNCDGTCVAFTSEKCLADRVNTREYDLFFNSGNKSGSSLIGLWASLGMVLAVMLS